MFKFSLVLFLVLIGNQLDAQCKRFYQSCARQAEGYTLVSQYGLKDFKSGEEASLQLPIHENIFYNLTLCSQENLGEVFLTLHDASGKMLYNGHDKGFSVNFEAVNTQTLTVKVISRKRSDLEILPVGCLMLSIAIRDNASSRSN
jgi:hypothetical protein